MATTTTTSRSRSSEAYTVSKMLQSINDVMAPVAATSHASVALKRKLDNGIMLDTSPQEIALLDLQAKVKHAAYEVAAFHQHGGDTRQWMEDTRKRGNDAFHDGKFREAADLYVQALTALDFGGSAERKRPGELQSQVQLTCNLAACLLKLKQWEKASQVCAQALRVDPTHVRARSQRAKALMKLGRFDEARSDVRRAIEEASTVCVVEEDAAAHQADEQQQLQLQQLHHQMDAIGRAERQERACEQQQLRFHTRMMRKAVGRLYEDKKDHVVTQRRVVDAASQEERNQSEVQTNKPSVGRWVAYYLANVLLFVYRLVTGIATTAANDHSRGLNE